MSGERPLCDIHRDKLTASGLVVAGALALSLGAADPAAAHDSGPHELVDCVRAEPEYRPGQTRFVFRNDCSDWVLISYCYEPPTAWGIAYQCARALRPDDDSAGPVRPGSLAYHDGDRDKLNDTKTATRYWFAACRVALNPNPRSRIRIRQEDTAAAREFCTLRSRNGGTEIWMGYNEHETLIEPAPED